MHSTPRHAQHDVLKGLPAPGGLCLTSMEDVDGTHIRDVFKDVRDIGFSIRKSDLEFIRCLVVNDGCLLSAAASRRCSARDLMHDLVERTNRLLKPMIQTPYLLEVDDPLTTIAYALYFCCSHDSFEAATLSYAFLVSTSRSSENTGGEADRVITILEKVTHVHLDLGLAMVKHVEMRRAAKEMWHLIETAAWIAHQRGHDMHGLSPKAYARARRFFVDDGDFWRVVKNADMELCANIIRVQTRAKALQAESDRLMDDLDLSFVDSERHDVLFRLWLAAYDHVADMRAWSLFATRARIRPEFLGPVEFEDRQTAAWRVVMRDREVELVGAMLVHARKRRDERLERLVADIGPVSVLTDKSRKKTKPKHNKPVIAVEPVESDESVECVMCMNADADVEFRCGHTCLCSPCADSWLAKSPTCPMCRCAL